MKQNPDIFSCTRFVRPARLQPKDRAALIAVSSPASAGQLREAVRSLESLGLCPVVYPSCKEHTGYLAGDDFLRTRDLMLAFSDPDIRAIFCLRGGYGSSRLLEQIDYDMIRQNPKAFIGFSDITALHISLVKKCNMITYHAPMPSSSYLKYDRSVTLASLRAALFSEGGSYDLIGLKKEKASAGYPEKQLMSGYLCGGNLTVFVSLLGTPFEPDTKDCILFFEDVNEHPYRIDRAFTSLRLAGKLDGCRGILLGTFSGYGPEEGRFCEKIIKDAASSLSLPVLSGLPFGHSRPNMTLPCGAWCSVSAAPVKDHIRLRLHISPSP